MQFIKTLGIILLCALLIGLIAMVLYPGFFFLDMFLGMEPVIICAALLILGFVFACIIKNPYLEKVMGLVKAQRRVECTLGVCYQDKVSFLLMQGEAGGAAKREVGLRSILDAPAAFPYLFLWRCFAAGAVPGLQNQWMAERSSVGSTPMHLRQ